MQKLLVEWKNYILIILVILAPAITRPQYAETKGAKEKARLAIFQFINETGSKNFDYLKGSISDAVASDIQENFYYERPNLERNQQLADVLLKNSSAFNEKELKGLCYTANIEYAIFGNFVQPGKNTIKVLSGIYSVKDNKIISFMAQEFKTDSSMFDNINELSVKFATSIKDYVKKQDISDSKQRVLIIKKISKEEEKPSVSELPSNKKSSVYFQAFGYGILGSINYERKFGSLFSAGLGGGFFPAETGNIITASIFLGISYRKIFFKAGPYVIVQDKNQIGAQANLGYNFEFFKYYFIAPSAAVLWTREAFYPYGALSMGVRF